MFSPAWDLAGVRQEEGQVVLGPSILPGKWFISTELCKHARGFLCASVLYRSKDKWRQSQKAGMGQSL